MKIVRLLPIFCFFLSPLRNKRPGRSRIFQSPATIAFTLQTRLQTRFR